MKSKLFEKLPETKTPFIDILPDEELERLNELLPWAAFSNDIHGRRFGKPYSDKKRTNPHTIPDKRIVELNKRYPLAELDVLEVGCFEGYHTCALSEFSKSVTAIDSRIENIAKTLVLTGMYGYKPNVQYCDLENDELVAYLPEVDVLHHVGVLYHLTDPVKHLKQMARITSKAIMLDTHVAPENKELDEYTVDGNTYRFYNYKEKGREAPFAGMLDHAKWLVLDDLKLVLTQCGFVEIDVVELRDERNGPRVLIYANK